MKEDRCLSRDRLDGGKLSTSRVLLYAQTVTYHLFLLFSSATTIRCLVASYTSSFACIRILHGNAPRLSRLLHRGNTELNNRDDKSSKRIGAFVLRFFIFNIHSEHIRMLQYVVIRTALAMDSLNSTPRM